MKKNTLKFHYILFLLLANITNILIKFYIKSRLSCYSFDYNMTSNFTLQLCSLSSYKEKKWLRLWETHRCSWLFSFVRWSVGEATKDILYMWIKVSCFSVSFFFLFLTLLHMDVIILVELFTLKYVRLITIALTIKEIRVIIAIW